jgi:hypothetical protein
MMLDSSSRSISVSLSLSAIKREKSGAEWTAWKAGGTLPRVRLRKSYSAGAGAAISAGDAGAVAPPIKLATRARNSGVLF